MLAFMTRSDEEIRKNAGTSRLLQNSSLRKVRSEEEKWKAPYMERQALILKNKELTEAEKRKRIGKVEDEMAREWKRGQELDKQIKADMKVVDEAQAAYKEASNEVYGRSLNRKDFLREEQKYLGGRSESYRRMFEAEDDYMRKSACEEQTPENNMEAVLSILEYQDGKEGRGGGIRERVDLSMRTLAHLTVGTVNEYILDGQLEKVNAARGLQPGQKGFLTKEALYEQPAAESDLNKRLRELYKAAGHDPDLSDEPEENEEKENAERNGEEINYGENEPENQEAVFERQRKIAAEQARLDAQWEEDPEANVFI